MARLRPQSPTSLVERVTQEIKASILSGDLPPGSQFSIAELCQELDVSHIPVREALRRLEADGLVLLRPSKSAIVTPLSLRELEELYRLRLLIEADLAERSAPAYTPQQLEQAQRLCDQLRSPAGDMRALINAEAHARLHQILLQPASGELTTRLLHRLWDVAHRYVSLVYDVRPVPADEPYRRHHELVMAAQKRDGAVMRTALVNHLEHSKAHMIDTLAPLLNADVASVPNRRQRDRSGQVASDGALA